MSEIPPDLHYTAEHEWIRRTGDDTVRVGITDFAQEALGDVVFVRLPDAGTDLTSGEAFGEVESTKSVSDLYAPVSAKVVAVNERSGIGSPELVNSDPYGGGWLIELQVDNDSVQKAFDGTAGRRGLPRHTGRMTLVMVPCARRNHPPDRGRSDVPADPAGEGTLGSGARYGRHIDGHSGWEAGRADPTRRRSSGQ